MEAGESEVRARWEGGARGDRGRSRLLEQLDELALALLLRVDLGLLLRLLPLPLLHLLPRLLLLREARRLHKGEGRAKVLQRG